MAITKDDLERLSENVPVSLIVELVEFRYRDRFKRIFWAGLTTLLTATLAVSGLSFRYQEGQRAIAMQQELQDVERLRQEEERRQINEYTERMSRADFRLQFARTPRSFASATLRLEVGVPRHIAMRRGQQTQLLLNAEAEGRYIIRASNLQRDMRDAGADSPVLFTPLIYLYRQDRDTIVEPMAYSARTDLAFEHTGAETYYLEVEELLGDPGQLTLTLDFVSSD